MPGVQGLCFICTFPWYIAQSQGHSRHLIRVCEWINEWMKHIWRNSWNSVPNERESPKLGQMKSGPVLLPSSGFQGGLWLIWHGGASACLLLALWDRGERGRPRAQTGCRWRGCRGHYGGREPWHWPPSLYFIFLFVPTYFQQCPHAG